MEKMHGALAGAVVDDDSAEGKFDTSAFVQNIENYLKKDEILEHTREEISMKNFNFAEESATRMRDRSQGAELLEEVAGARKTLQSFRSALKSHLQAGRALTETVKSARRFYKDQLNDMLLIAEGYANYCSNLEAVKAELEKNIKSGMYQKSSPSHNASSSTTSGDSFQTGVKPADENPDQFESKQIPMQSSDPPRILDHPSGEEGALATFW